MRLSSLHAARAAAILVTCAIGSATPATAVQLPLVGDERLNELGSGLPGSPYDTANGGVDFDQIAGPGAHPGEVLVLGQMPSLNFHTTGAPLANVEEIFAQPLIFTLEGALVSTTVNVFSATLVEFVLEFGTTADGLFDLTLTDPSDGTLLLRGDLMAGMVLGSPTGPLTASFFLDPTAPPKNIVGNVTALFSVDGTTPWAGLFAATGMGTLQTPVAFGGVQNFDVGDADPDFDFDDIFNNFVAGGQNPSAVISFLAESNGTIFAVPAPVVPEPSVSALVALGVFTLVGFRKRAGRF